MQGVYYDTKQNARYEKKSLTIFTSYIQPYVFKEIDDIS